MTSEQLLRASIDSSKHGSIDVELKALKLCSRRLQSLMTIHGAELQVLHRLYYKNKNQHRGALFWRNVAEVRRFLERLEKLNLLDSINGLRSSFYDTAQNLNATKGPWTHFPSEMTIVKFREYCQNAVKLMEKMSERCLAAYRSFHRSLQSAAFLQILLMFVAIASRARTLATELSDILHRFISCSNRLISITDVGTKTRDSGPTSISREQPMELDDTVPLHISPPNNPIIPISMRQQAAQSAPVVSLITHSKAATPPIVVEKTMVYKAKIESKQPPDPAPLPKKKKRKVPRNEIDDIFGF